MKKKLLSVLLSAILILSIPFSVGAEQPTQFDDVANKDWFCGAVQYVVEHGMFSGTSGTTFSPNAKMTRGMVVTVLGRKCGVDKEQYRPGAAGAPTHPFTDVKDDAYFAPYVNWAKKYSIVSGTSKTTFNPYGNITRQDLATILYNFAKYTANDNTINVNRYNTFPDTAKVSGYAGFAMAWATTHGVINGDTGGKLNPKGYATRAQVAQMLKNSHDVLTKTDLPEPEANPEKTGTNTPFVKEVRRRLEPELAKRPYERANGNTGICVWDAQLIKDGGWVGPHDKNGGTTINGLMYRNEDYIVQSALYILTERQGIYDVYCIEERENGQIYIYYG